MAQYHEAETSPFAIVADAVKLGERLMRRPNSSIAAQGVSNAAPHSWSTLARMLAHKMGVEVVTGEVVHGRQDKGDHAVTDVRAGPVLLTSGPPTQADGELKKGDVVARVTFQGREMVEPREMCRAISSHWPC